METFGWIIFAIGILVALFISAGGDYDDMMYYPIADSLLLLGLVFVGLGSIRSAAKKRDKQLDLIQKWLHAIHTKMEHIEQKQPGNENQE